MPYKCAKAVCATFCYEIAGALIPIFGPSFPSQCIPPGSPDFQRMIIDPRIIYEAQREAEMWRRDYHRGATSNSVGYTSLSIPSPGRSDQRPVRRAMRDTERRLRVDTRMVSLSPYSTDTDADGQLSGPDSASSSSSGPPGYAYQFQAIPQLLPNHRHGSSWTAVNRPYPPTTVPASQQGQATNVFRDHPHQQGYQQPPPNPLLSAVPRFAPPQPPFSFHSTLAHSQSQSRSHGHTHAPRSQPSLPRTGWPVKRPIVLDDVEQGYEGGESQRGSPALEYIAQKRKEEERCQGQGQGQSPGQPGLDLAEKKAALLLMNLSVQDQVWAGEGGGREKGERSPDSHRSKRRRATSF